MEVEVIAAARDIEGESEVEPKAVGIVDEDGGGRARGECGGDDNCRWVVVVSKNLI